MAEDLGLAMDALGFLHDTVDNQEEALRQYDAGDFCLVLLDLEIKLRPDSMKAHADAGRELLRRMRALPKSASCESHPRVPIVVVSAHPKEFDDGIRAMQDGADDVIQKLVVSSRERSDRIRDALNRCGRGRHELCAGSSGPRWVLSVPAETRKQRFTVEIDGRAAPLRPASLLVLLRLMIGKLHRKAVHRSELGWQRDSGFQGMARLREDLRPGGVDPDSLVETLHNGYYSLADHVRIGACNFPCLRAIGGRTETLAREIEGLQHADGGDVTESVTPPSSSFGPNST